MMNHLGENVVRIEAQALSDLADRIGGPMADAFNRGVELLYCCPGRVVVTGMGKSGLIARKVAATLSSTGTPALFMHPVEALHGDLGMLAHGDVVIALSASGETDEILQLLATIKRLRLPLIAVTCDEIDGAKNKAGTTHSTLASSAEVFLSCAVAEEGCTMGLAPTASTTAMLALGDALAVAVAEKKGFKEEDFARLHPGGKLGKRLARVETLMHKGDAVPRVSPKTKMPDVIYEMSRKKLGITAVVEGERLVGIISDGDLRRLLERKGKDVLDMTAEECMTRDPKTVSGAEVAATALAIMEERKITSLVVIGEDRKIQGIVHLHDLWGTEMV
jgi:arabinose-5-phosphate isomerase